MLVSSCVILIFLALAFQTSDLISGLKPYVPSVHPQGLVYIVAERGAELIAAQYREFGK